MSDWHEATFPLALIAINTEIRDLLPRTWD